MTRLSRLVGIMAMLAAGLGGAIALAQPVETEPAATSRASVPAPPAARWPTTRAAAARPLVASRPAALALRPTRTITPAVGAQVQALTLSPDGKTIYVAYRYPVLDAASMITAYTIPLAILLAMVVMTPLGMYLFRWLWYRRVPGESYCRRCNLKVSGLPNRDCPDCGYHLSGRGTIVAHRLRWPIVSWGTLTLLVVLAAAWVVRLHATPGADGTWVWRSPRLYAWMTNRGLRIHEPFTMQVLAVSALSADQGTRLRDFDLHPAAFNITALRLTPDGRYLFATWNGSVSRWPAAGGAREELFDPLGDGSRITSVATASDQSVMVGFRGGQLIRFTMQAGVLTPSPTVQLPAMGNERFHGRVRLAPTTRPGEVVAATEKSIWIVNLLTGRSRWLAFEKENLVRDVIDSTPDGRAIALLSPQQKRGDVLTTANRTDLPAAIEVLEPDKPTNPEHAWGELPYLNLATLRVAPQTGQIVALGYSPLSPQILRGSADRPTWDLIRNIFAAPVCFAVSADGRRVVTAAVPGRLVPLVMEEPSVIEVYDLP